MKLPIKWALIALPILIILVAAALLEYLMTTCWKTVIRSSTSDIENLEPKPALE